MDENNGAWKNRRLRPTVSSHSYSGKPLKKAASKSGAKKNSGWHHVKIKNDFILYRSAYRIGIDPSHLCRHRAYGGKYSWVN